MNNHFAMHTHNATPFAYIQHHLYDIRNKSRFLCMNAENDENSYTFSQSSQLQQRPLDLPTTFLALNAAVRVCCIPTSLTLPYISIYVYTLHFPSNNRPGITYMYKYTFATSYLPVDITTLYYTYPIIMADCDISNNTKRFY